ncbi:hypothetical protein [Mycoplasma leonicaptivi]|uniref:hypothetical protein n=1 Tax=Mycoplasma leonicaptivi TaxID=36742 RepID=UPI000489F9CE|nr:hypothetical protein [Mycoplasma leonicaptivi]
MENQNLFKIYQLSDKLQKGLSKFIEREVKYVLPVLTIGDEIIFMEARKEYKTEKTWDLFNENDTLNISVVNNVYFKMNYDLFMKHASQMTEYNISALSELDILDKIKLIFLSDDPSLKLVYIRKKEKDKIFSNDLEQLKTQIFS